MTIPIIKTVGMLFSDGFQLPEVLPSLQICCAENAKILLIGFNMTSKNFTNHMDMEDDCKIEFIGHKPAVRDTAKFLLMTARYGTVFL